jgi:hypothetical protein
MCNCDGRRWDDNLLEALMIILMIISPLAWGLGGILLDIFIGSIWCTIYYLKKVWEHDYREYKPVQFDKKVAKRQKDLDIAVKNLYKRI